MTTPPRKYQPLRSPSNRRWQEAVGRLLYGLRTGPTSEVSARSGIHHTTIAKLEQGIADRMGLPPLYLLAKAHNIHLLDLLDPTPGRPHRPWDPGTPALPDLDAAARKALRALRTERKWGTPRLAEAIGRTGRVSQKAIHRLETGQDGMSLARLRLCAAALDTTLTDLLDWRPRDDDRTLAGGTLADPALDQPAELTG